MKNDGGPAFPLIGAESDHDGSERAYSGMTLRDYFAAAALQGLCAKELHTVGMYEPSKFAQIVVRAYTYADAMLLERAK